MLESDNTLACKLHALYTARKFTFTYICPEMRMRSDINTANKKVAGMLESASTLACKLHALYQRLRTTSPKTYVAAE